MIQNQSLTKMLLLVTFIHFFISSCNDDDQVGTCYNELGLGIIEEINSEVGIVRAPGNQFCSEDYVIETEEKVENRPLGSLIPCNLEENFQVDGLRVTYSGYVYERINDGDQCADFFEISEIKLNNP